LNNRSRIQLDDGSKARREALAPRFKDPTDPFKFAIVRDMWLTGFDVPSLHTLYVDKPMRGHGLMQAIARANLRRVVRRVLRKHGYPPDKEEKATLTVLEQAEQIAKDWAEA
jgi:type I site-specific restriction-modification system R (restriction) subunit